MVEENDATMQLEESASQVLSEWIASLPDDLLKLLNTTFVYEVKKCTHSLINDDSIESEGIGRGDTIFYIFDPYEKVYEKNPSSAKIIELEIVKLEDKNVEFEDKNVELENKIVDEETHIDRDTCEDTVRTEVQLALRTIREASSCLRTLEIENQSLKQALYQKTKEYEELEELYDELADKYL